MTAILALIPYLFKIIGWIMDAGKAKAEQREAFRQFVDKFDTIGNSSVDQYEDVKNQLDDLKP